MQVSQIRKSARTVVLSCDDSPTCGTASSASRTATAGATSLIRVGSPGTERGVATLTPACAPTHRPADIDGNRMVGADDIAALLSAWGARP